MRWQKQVIKWRICVKLEIPTCGLWTGVRSLSSWLCGCRWTRFCDWACWAIAFSFSGYNWASRSRIYHTWQLRSLSGCTFRLLIRAIAKLQDLPDLQASSWLNALSPAAASTRSSPSSGPQIFPPPEYLVSRCLHPSPLRASSLERSHLTPVNKWQSYACVFLTLKQVIWGQWMVYLYDSFQLAVLL